MRRAHRNELVDEPLLHIDRVGLFVVDRGFGIVGGDDRGRSLSQPCPLVHL